MSGIKIICVEKVTEEMIKAELEGNHWCCPHNTCHNDGHKPTETDAEGGKG